MNDKLDVYFINMPFYVIQFPSMGLSLLKAILKKDGFKSRIFYGNLFFAPEMGLPFYNLSFNYRTQFLSGWIFSPLVFPDYKDDVDKYVEMFLNSKKLDISPDDLKKDLLTFRLKGKEFIHRSAEKILKEKPAIVACTSIDLQYMSSLALLLTIRTICPEVITLMGGPSCEHKSGLMTHKTFPRVDYIVSGEADDIISPLIGAILKKGRDLRAEEVMPGVFAPVHRREGYPEVTVSIKESLSDLPNPDYDEYIETLHSLPEFKEMVKPYLTFESSRGCWWGEKKPCNFCGLNSVSYRYRKKDTVKILEELESLSEKYGIKNFRATDTIMDMDHLKNLLPEIIKIGSPYKIFYEIKSNLNRSQIELLRKAGVIKIQPGIESLDSRILKLMNKGVKAWQNINLLKWCLYYGIHTGWNLLYGFPGEQDLWYEEMARIIPLLFHFQPPVNISPVTYPRCSTYYIKAEEYGLSMKLNTFYSHIMPLSEDILRDFTFYFQEEGYIERKNDDMHDLFNIGLNLLKKEVEEWNLLFRSEKRPVLTMTDYKEKLEIKDSRPCAVKPFFTLTGMGREIYLACEEPSTEENLIKTLTDKGYEEKEIMRVNKELLDWKIMIEVDRRILSLALRDDSMTFDID